MEKFTRQDRQPLSGSLQAARRHKERLAVLHRQLITAGYFKWFPFTRQTQFQLNRLLLRIEFQILDVRHRLRVLLDLPLGPQLDRRIADSSDGSFDSREESH